MVITVCFTTLRVTFPSSSLAISWPASASRNRAASTSLATWRARYRKSNTNDYKVYRRYLGFSSSRSRIPTNPCPPWSPRLAQTYPLLAPPTSYSHSLYFYCMQCHFVHLHSPLRALFRVSPPRLSTNLPAILKVRVVSAIYMTLLREWNIKVMLPETIRNDDF